MNLNRLQKYEKLSFVAKALQLRFVVAPVFVDLHEQFQENLLSRELLDVGAGLHTQFLDGAAAFYAQGGRYLFLDEVHYYPHWQTAIKNLIDEYADLHIVFTGSSMLQLEAGEGDLSRRLMDYHLPGHSFREYLRFEGIADFPIYRLEEILQRHVQISFEVKEKLGSIQPHFNAYLQHGYYPFYKSVQSG